MKSRRKAMSGGGYVTSWEMREEQERYLAELQVLRTLMVNGGRSLGGCYGLAHLRRKYSMGYAHLRDLEISSK